MRYTKTILKNGLRLITVPMSDNPSVTILVMVEAGSKYETKEINGLSHFLEHMAFKGTTRRPKATNISQELDALGAHYNAFTSQEFTGYYAKVAINQFDKVLDIVSDLFLNPIFPKEEIQKEKGVIIEEIRMYQDMPHQDVQEVLGELLHGDQPAGWRVIGTEDNIRSFTREQLLSYRQSHYVSSASTVVVAGSFDESTIQSKIEKAFEQLSSSQKHDKIKVVEKQSEPMIRVKFKETDQTHIALAIRTFPVFDDRVYVMDVLTTILGKGMSSRLFSKMRDQLGICYYINSSSNSYTDHGDLTIAAGVDVSRLEEAIKGILEECRRLKDELVSEVELQKAKDYISGTSMLALETSESRSEFFGSQEVIKGSIESLEAYITRIKTVAPDDIQKLAKEIFVDKNLNMAIVGKVKDDSQFKPYFTLGS